jgi:predicted nuclease of restriction endonuclease-like (RecB) superfamily
MLENEINNAEYSDWLNSIKVQIHNSQIKAALSVNAELISLYWNIGKSIVEKQEIQGWGNSVVEKLSKDLKTHLNNINGFSRTNLFAMRQLYLFYKQHSEFVPQAVGQIPWGHNRLILNKIKDVKQALFYIQSAIENGWSRNILELQIEGNLFERQGNAITNFQNTLTKPQSELAEQTLKDPYIFDFLTLEKDAHELEIERQLVAHVTKFLLELGKGFAFIGRQYELQIGKKTRYLDLLFYHIRLRCFVVVELKGGEFEPEFAGKMNYYLSAVDDILKTGTDNPTIGIILCRSKEKIDVEYALRDFGKPIGVSNFMITEIIPNNLKSELPTVEQIENELTNNSINEYNELNISSQT